MEQKLNFNEEIVTFLKEEEKDLRIKAKKCKENGDYPMYTKLINAYERIVELIKKYDWQLQYSEYKLDDKNGQKQVAVFEENGDGQIRNHKVWNIQEGENNKDNNVNLIAKVLRMNDTYNLQINKIEKELKNVGINVINNDNSLKTFPEVLEELSDVWKELNNKEDDIVKAYISETVVGIRDRNLLYEIMNNTIQTI